MQTNRWGPNFKKEKWRQTILQKKKAKEERAMQDRQFILSEIQRRIIAEKAYMSRENNEVQDAPEYLLTTKEKRVWMRKAFHDASENLMRAADALQSAREVVTNSAEFLDIAENDVRVAKHARNKVGKGLAQAGETFLFSAYGNHADAKGAYEKAEQ